MNFFYYFLYLVSNHHDAAANVDALLDGVDVDHGRQPYWLSCVVAEDDLAQLGAFLEPLEGIGVVGERVFAVDVDRQGGNHRSSRPVNHPTSPEEQK